MDFDAEVWRSVTLCLKCHCQAMKYVSSCKDDMTYGFHREVVSTGSTTAAWLTVSTVWWFRQAQPTRHGSHSKLNPLYHHRTRAASTVTDGSETQSAIFLA
jgi:hypothetical protein